MLDLGLDVLFKGKNMARLLGGLGVALKISAVSVIISLPLGILLGVLMTEEIACSIPAMGRNRTGPIRALEKLCIASITFCFIGVLLTFHESLFSNCLFVSGVHLTVSMA